MERGQRVARRLSQDQPGALQAPRGVLSPGCSAHPQPDHGHQPRKVQAGVTSSMSITPIAGASGACVTCISIHVALGRHGFPC